MEEKIQNIIIGVIILLVICCLALLSISSGVFSGSNKTDNKLSDYKLLSKSDKKILIYSTNNNVRINIPKNICIDRDIDVNISNGIIVGNTDNIQVNPNV